MNESIRCACAANDARECARNRYQEFESELWEMEPCECSCHDEEPDDYDEAVDDGL